jgi:tetratricopeptide (TPR) repeat protein
MAPRPGLGTLRPQPGIATKPAPNPGLSRPSLQGRPTTLPGQSGRPGAGAITSRPSTRPSFPTPARPGRPGIGGNRPTTLPGDLAQRPGIGDGNSFWNNGTIGSGNLGNTVWGNNNNFNNIHVGTGWGLPGSGWGYGGGAGAWNSGYVNPHYGWYNGCWGGNWGYNGGWWAPFAVGAATWGLASTLNTWGWGYAGGYTNPYYASMPAAVVATSPYDYSQPVVANDPMPDDRDADEAVFDAALVAFKKGDFAAALAGCDKAVGLSPDDSVIHEVRALALFALGRYPEAAATLNAVLAVAPGMDWTTMSSLYGSIDTYTQQLRKLEEFCRATPDGAAAHFVLAYHYLVGGHAEMAADALRLVVAKQPGDVVAKRLLESLEPPEDAAPGASDRPTSEGVRGSAAESSAGGEIDLVGTWTATSGKDSVELSITEDSRFAWKAVPAGRPAVEIAGTIQTSREAIALVSESAGTMTGQVAAKGPDAFGFTLAGTPPGTKPIAFQRRK